MPAVRTAFGLLDGTLLWWCWCDSEWGNFGGAAGVAPANTCVCHLQPLPLSLTAVWPRMGMRTQPVCSAGLTAVVNVRAAGSGMACLFIAVFGQQIAPTWVTETFQDCSIAWWVGLGIELQFTKCTGCVILVLSSCKICIGKILPYDAEYMEIDDCKHLPGIGIMAAIMKLEFEHPHYLC